MELFSVLSRHRPRLRHLFRRVYRVTYLRFTRRIITIGFCNVITSIRLPNSNVNKVSLNCILRSFRFSVERISLLSVLLVSRSRGLLAVVPLSFFCPIRDDRGFLQIVAFRGCNVCVLIRRLTCHPSFFIRHVSCCLNLKVLVIGLLSGRRAVLVARFRISSDNVSVLPISSVPNE